jgi:hypothetical protein
MAWALLALAIYVESVFAHPGERGLVLLLPTGLYMLGGATAVALSFVVVALLPSPAFSRLTQSRDIGSLAEPRPVVPSAVTLALCALLVFAGYSGSRDPLNNPLPLTVWTLWWVGFTFLVVLFGDLWALLNPWRAAYRLLVRTSAVPPLRYPERLGYWPAVALLLAFAWFELIDPAPQDPARLATAVLAYAVVTLAGMVLFGESAWLERGEAFSVFFRIVGRLAPFSIKGGKLLVRVPACGLLEMSALPASGIAFIVVALASVSFDGLSRTFWWLSLIGENPLEHPGRSAVMTMNTLGLLATVAVIASLYLVAVRLGGETDYGRCIVAIVPIAFGYHFAHYLPSFLVDVQYAAIALSDPFDRGWNLLGARDLEPTTSFLSHHSTVHAMWNVQVAGIVAAHVAAVFVAHALALRRHASVRRALASQVPMTTLMVAYTVFGLWLLSTPVA